MPVCICHTFPSPSLNRCNFKSQCPDSNPLIILSWFLLSLGNSPNFLAEGLLIKHLACLCHEWTADAPRFLLIQPLITSVEAFADLPRAGLCL